jgi:hypothetical protein
MMRALIFAALCLSCGSATTGADYVNFEFAAAGPKAATGTSYAFRNALGYEVTLTKARFFIGAVYLNEQTAIVGRPQESCLLSSAYVGQVTTGRWVDVLSPSPQTFPTQGNGIASQARLMQLWLTDGSVNDVKAAPLVLEATGTAKRNNIDYPFQASVTIGANRLSGASDPAKPGANPICLERIVSPIPVSVTPIAGARVMLRIDPAGWFANVAFHELPKAASGIGYTFNDATEGQPSINLYRGLHALTGVYSLE